MKFSFLPFATLLGGASALTIFGKIPVRSSTTVSMVKETSRAEFFGKVGLSTISAATLILPGVANAAKYGSFGAGSPQVIDPSEAIIDKDILDSSAVQNALQGIKAYAFGVKNMQEALESNPQADIGPYIRKNFDFVNLRRDLNVLNSAFDEDTQRGTDRIIRIIMQDITELETSNKQKDGIERSDRRLDIMMGKLSKLSSAFDDLLAFSK